MLVTVGKVVGLAVLSAGFIYFWEEPYLLPLKVFVVYLHELSHAIAALLTGGEITAIAVNWDQSGYMISRGGNFLVTAIAGYLGSILWGALMLNASLRGRWGSTVSVLVAIVLLVFTLWPEKNNLTFIEKLPKYFSGLFWGGLLTFTGLMAPRVNRLLLFFMGGLTSLYSLYDLNDFFNGEIMKTDAGILAYYLLGDSALTRPLAYAIALAISLLAIWLLYRMISRALMPPAAEVAESTELSDELPPPPMEITPEMLAWLEQLKAKQSERR